MTKEEWVDYYDQLIENLDSEEVQRHRETVVAIGNQREVYQQVGESMRAELSYQNKRHELVRLREQYKEVSPNVQAFLTKKPIETKFDVDSGKAKLDTSLNPLGGKEV
jgi:hypothetical protein